MFDSKSLRSTSFEMIQNLVKIILLLSEMIRKQWKQAMIKNMISKDDSSTSTQYIIFITDKHVTSLGFSCKGR